MDKIFRGSRMIPFLCVLMVMVVAHNFPFRVQSGTGGFSGTVLPNSWGEGFEPLDVEMFSTIEYKKASADFSGGVNEQATTSSSFVERLQSRLQFPHRSNFAFAGAVYDGHGYLWYIPTTAKSLVKVSKSGGTVSKLDTWPTAIADAAGKEKKLRFSSGVLDDADGLWLLPFSVQGYSATHFVRLDVRSHALSTFSMPHISTPAAAADSLHPCGVVAGIFDDVYRRLWLIPSRPDPTLFPTSVTCTIHTTHVDIPAEDSNVFPASRPPLEAVSPVALPDVPSYALEQWRDVAGVDESTASEAIKMQRTVGGGGFGGVLLDGESVVWLLPPAQETVPVLVAIPVEYAVPDSTTHRGRTGSKINRNQRPIKVRGGWPPDLQFVTAASTLAERVGVPPFSSGVYDNVNDCLWLVPGTASHIVKVDAVSGAMRSFGAWPSDSAERGFELEAGLNVFSGLTDIPDHKNDVTLAHFYRHGPYFSGAAFDGARYLVLSNYRSSDLILFDTKPIPPSAPKDNQELQEEGFMVAVSLLDKRKQMKPVDSLDAQEEQRRRYLVKRTWSSVVFDGISLWLIPAHDGSIGDQTLLSPGATMRLIDRSKTTLSQMSFSFSGWTSSTTRRSLFAQTGHFKSTRYTTPARKAGDDGPDLSFYGIVHTEKYIWLPRIASKPGQARITTINKQTCAVENIPIAGADAWFNETSLQSLFVGAIYDGHEHVWLISRRMPIVFAVNIHTKQTVSFKDEWPSAELGTDIKSRYTGGCATENGDIIFAPRESEYVLFITPTNTISAELQVQMKAHNHWPPEVDRRAYGFQGAVCHHTASSAYLIPSTASHVVKVRTDDPSLPMVGFGVWPKNLSPNPASLHQPTEMGWFAGGCLDARDENLVLTPYRDIPAVVFSTRVDSMDLATMPAGTYKSAPNNNLRGCAATGHTEVFLSRAKGNQIVRLDTTGNSAARGFGSDVLPVTAPNGPSNNELFSGILFDGSSLWLPNTNMHHTVRFGDRRTYSPSANGFASSGFLVNPTPLFIESDGTHSAAAASVVMEYVGEPVAPRSIVFDGGNFLYFARYPNRDSEASVLSRLDKNSGTMTSVVTNWESAAPHFDTGMKFNAFAGMVLQSPTMLWLIPHNCRAAIRVNVSAAAAAEKNQLLVVELPSNTVLGSYGGGTFADNHVWLFGHQAAAPGRIDVFDNTFTAGTLLNTIPAPDKPPFCGAVYDGQRYIYTIPYNEPSMFRFSAISTAPVAEQKKYDRWPHGFRVEKSAYCGGVYDGINNIWPIPQRSKAIVKFVISAEQFTLVSEVFPGASPSLSPPPERWGGTMCFDGRSVILAGRFDNAPLVVIDTFDHQFKPHLVFGYPASAGSSEADSGPSNVASCVFDGSALWLLPTNGTIIRVGKANGAATANLNTKVTTPPEVLAHSMASQKVDPGLAASNMDIDAVPLLYQDGVEGTYCHAGYDPFRRKLYPVPLPLTKSSPGLLEVDIEDTQAFNDKPLDSLEEVVMRTGPHHKARMLPFTWPDDLPDDAIRFAIFVAVSANMSAAMWFPPHFSKYVLKLNLESKQLSKFSEGWNSDVLPRPKYSGGVLDGLRRIWFIPSSVTARMGYIDISSGIITNDILMPNKAQGPTELKFCGATYDGHRYIYFVPLNAHAMLRLDQFTMEMKLFDEYGCGKILPSTQNKFCGGAWSSRFQRLYLTPVGVSKVVGYDAMKEQFTQCFDLQPQGNFWNSQSTGQQLAGACASRNKLYIVPRQGKGFLTINLDSSGLAVEGVRGSTPPFNSSRERAAPSWTHQKGITEQFCGCIVDEQSVWFIPATPGTPLARFNDPSVANPHRVIDRHSRFQTKATASIGDGSGTNAVTAGPTLQSNASLSAKIPPDVGLGKSIGQVAVPLAGGTLTSVAQHNLGTNFMAGAFDGERYLYLAPFVHARPLVRIDIYTQERKEFMSAVMPQTTDFVLAGAIFDKWSNCVILPPFVGPYIIGFNVTSSEFWEVGEKPHPGSSHAFAGGYATRTDLWICPNKGSSQVVMYVEKADNHDKSTWTVKSLAKWPGGTVPILGGGSHAIFAGCVGDADGNLWLIPHSAKAMYRVQTDPTTRGQEQFFASFNNWPAEINRNKNMFRMGCFDGEHLWLMSTQSALLLKLHTRSFSVSVVWIRPTAGLLPTTSWTPSDIYSSSLLFDGVSSLFLIPRKFGDPLMRVDIKTHRLTAFNDYPATAIKEMKIKIGTDNFHAGAFDGVSVWMLPYSSTVAVRWMLKSSFIVNQHGRTSSGLLVAPRQLPPKLELLPHKLTWNPDASSHSAPLPSGDSDSFDKEFFDYASAAYDGREYLYLPPTGAQQFCLAFNVNTKTSERLAISTDPLVEDSYYAAIFDGRKHIWLVPNKAPKFVLIDVNTHEFKTLGRLFSAAAPPFLGATATPTHIWLAPYKEGVVWRGDLKTQSFKSVISATGYRGIVYDGFRFVYLVPVMVQPILGVDTTVDTAHKKAEYKAWPADFNMQYDALGYPIYLRQRYELWVLPSAKGTAILRVELLKGGMSTVHLWGTTNRPSPMRTIAGIYDGHRTLVLMPHQERDNLVAIDIHTFESRVISVFPGQNISEANTSPAPDLPATSAHQFSSMIFDGQSLWLTPYNASFMYQWAPDYSSEVIPPVFNVSNGTVPIPPTGDPTNTKTASTSKSYATTRTASIESEPTGERTSTLIATSTPAVTRTLKRTASPSLTLVIDSPVPSTIEPTSVPSTPEPTIPPPPPPPGRVVKISTVLPGGGAEGEAVMTSAAGSTVATSTFAGTGTVSSIGRVSASTRSLDCPLSEDDPEPSRFELPIQFSVGGKLGTSAGSAVGNAAAMAVVIGVCLMWQRQHKANSTLIFSSSTDAYDRGPTPLFKILSAIASALFLYLGPNSVGAATTVIVHGETTAEIAAAVTTYLLVISVAGLYFHAIWKQAPALLKAVPERSDAVFGGDNALSEGARNKNLQMKYSFVARSDHGDASTTTTTESSDEEDGSTDKREKSDPESTSEDDDDSSEEPQDRRYPVEAPKPLVGGHAWFFALYAPLFDGTSDFDRPILRLYSVPEFVSAALAQILAGIRPDKGCIDVAWGILGVSVLMLAYLVFLRPYRTKLDQLFSIAVNGLQVGLTICTVVALQEEVKDPEHWSLKLIETFLYLLVIIYYVQVFVQAYWAYHCAERRKRQYKEDGFVGQSTALSLAMNRPAQPPPAADTESSEEGQEMASLAVPMLNPLQGDEESEEEDDDDEI